MILLLAGIFDAFFCTPPDASQRFVGESSTFVFVIVFDFLLTCFHPIPTENTLM